MTESKRQDLLTACAFAKVFLDEADAELRGANHERRVEASTQLTEILAKMEARE